MVGYRYFLELPIRHTGRVWPGGRVLFWLTGRLLSLLARWHLTKVYLRRIGNKKRAALTKAGENYVASTIRTTRPWCHNLCMRATIGKKTIDLFHYVIGILGNLSYNRNVTLETLEIFFRQHSTFALHSCQTTGHSLEQPRDLSTSGHFPSLSHKMSTVNLRHSSHLGTKFNHSAHTNVLFPSFTA